MKDVVAMIVEDIDPDNHFKGKNGTDIMLKFKTVDWEEGDRIGYDMTANDLIIRQVIISSVNTSICRVQLMTNNPNDFLDNRCVQPGTIYTNYTLEFKQNQQS